MQYNLTLTFEEAAFGCRKEFKFQRSAVCDCCNGTGAKAGTQPQTCPTCGGTGQQRVTMNSPFGQVQTMRTCPDLRRQGQDHQDKCPKCSGSGFMRVTRTVTLNVPAGVDDGQNFKTIRARASRGATADLRAILAITCTWCVRTRSSSATLRPYCDVPVSFTQAALGGEIDVPTLNGTTKFSIPAGTQEGTSFRIRNEGIQQFRGNGRGDLFFTVHVEAFQKEHSF